jgi:hypothetical protein
VRDGKPVIARLPEIDFIDDKAGKPVGINKFIGLISLAIVFLISILFPFLYLQVDTRKVNLEMTGLWQKIERQQQRVATYNRAMAGLKRVFEAVENTSKPICGGNRSFFLQLNYRTRVLKIYRRVVICNTKG